MEGTPGPGAYSIEARGSSPSISIKNTRHEGKDNGFPGPGSYLIKDSSKIIPPSYSLSKAVKLKASFNKFPGPGNYSLTPIKQGPYWKLGSEQRDNLNFSKTPGPGTYLIGQKTDLPSFTFKSRYEEKKRDNSPGPGAYSPTTLEKKNFFTLGSSQKMPFKPKDIPGPGAYSPEGEKKKYKLGVFGKTERKLLEISNDIPGAGTYESKSSLSGPKFTLSKKFTEKFSSVPV